LAAGGLYARRPAGINPAARWKPSSLHGGAGGLLVRRVPRTEHLADLVAEKVTNEQIGPVPVEMRMLLDEAAEIKPIVILPRRGRSSQA
jgi:hypothetical protein